MYIKQQKKKVSTPHYIAALAAKKLTLHALDIIQYIFKTIIKAVPNKC